MSNANIDYRIRPAKHIERQMLCDLFRCLSPFGTLESYRYWGFGAIYFADFVLIHKSLGISNMLSMERDPNQEDRTTFNRPYKCIDLDFRASQTVLASVEHWGVRTIAWLDYTDKLDSKILSDIHFFISNSCPGSVLVVTINCQADKLPIAAAGLLAEGHSVTADKEASPLKLLRERVGPDNIPQGTTDKMLVGWGTAEVQARIIANTVAEALQIRNGTRKAGTRYKYQQLVHFRYEDGARMLTIGGLICQEGQEPTVNQCLFDKLAFYRPGDEAYKIAVPLLTPKEKNYLDTQLPVVDTGTLTVPGIPASEVKKYMDVYRYFPTFIVGE